MAIRQSKGLRNHLLSGGSFRDAFQGGELRIYSGAQPSAADDAPSGTLLLTITAASAARTAEVQATGTVTLTGGASGSVDTVTVNSIDILGASVPFNTSLNQTASDVAAQINRNTKNKLYKAEASGAVVTIKAKPGLGTLVNTHVVTATLTTITASYANMASGVNSANGLSFNAASAGSIAKLTGQVWSGVVAAGGTAGWFRLLAPVADSHALDAAEVYMRLDGNIATSGANLNMANTTLTLSATETINTFTPTEPAQ